MEQVTVVEEKATEKNEFELGINSPMLERCVSDINSILNKTVFTMKEKNTNEATITIKLAVSLDEVDDMSKISVKHDVSAVMQLKQKKSGASEGEYVIVFNEETGMFEAKPIKDAQMNFDDVVMANSEDDGDAPASRKMIGTGRVAIPTAEDVAEAAENEIEEEEEEEYEYEEPEDEDSDDEEEDEEEEE